jgi:hypothetical protein
LPIRSSVPGCSPERHARPSSWAASCLVLVVDVGYRVGDVAG